MHKPNTVWITSNNVYCMCCTARLDRVSNVGLSTKAANVAREEHFTVKCELQIQRHTLCF